MDQRYGIHRTANFMGTIIGETLMLERRRSGMLESCASIPMAEAVEMARFILSMTGPLAHEAVAAMEAG